MDNKKLKQVLSTSAITIAIVSFLSISSDDISVKQEEKEDDDKSKISNYTRNNSAISGGQTNISSINYTRSFVAKLISVLGFIVSLAFKIMVSLIKAGFKLAKLSDNLFFNILIDSLAIFIILLTIFIVLFKLLYPDHSLKEFLTIKNILLISLTSLIISVMLNCLDLFEKQKALLIIFEGLSISILIFYLYKFLLNSKTKLFIGPLALIKTQDGKKKLLLTISFIMINSILKIIALDNKVLKVIINLIYVFIIIGVIAYLVSKKRKRKLVDIELSFPTLD